MFQREAEMVLVEGSSPGDIGYLIAHAMDAENTAQSVARELPDDATRKRRLSTRSNG
jgi:hypothetical protein